MGHIARWSLHAHIVDGNFCRIRISLYTLTSAENYPFELIHVMNEYLHFESVNVESNRCRISLQVSVDKLYKLKGIATTAFTINVMEHAKHSFL